MKKLLTVLLISLCCCFAVEVKAQEGLRYNKAVFIRINGKEGLPLVVPENKVWEIVSSDYWFELLDENGNIIYHCSKAINDQLPIYLPLNFKGKVKGDANGNINIIEYDIIK